MDFQQATKRIKPTHWTHWFALGLGSGLAPKAPGTFGTLAALPLVIGAHYYLALPAYIAFVLALTLLAVYCAARTQRDFGIHDPGAIVSDEWAGLAVTLIALPSSWLVYGLAFVLFRFFDIVKPWPIRVIDARVHGGWGNVLDDVLAGGFACALLHLAVWYGL